MELDDERCPACGLLYRMVGRRHNCRGWKEEDRSVGFRPPVEDTKEASGTARKAPSGSSSGGPSRHSPEKVSVAVKQPVMAAQETGRGEAEQSSRLIHSRRGRPLRKDKDKTLEALKPWEAEGMSRRTWFKRKAEGKL